MINNKVAGGGFRCVECGGVFPFMFGDVCNKCRTEDKRHKELIDALRNRTHSKYEKVAISKAIRFKRVDGRYLDSKGNEITTDMLLKHEHFIVENEGVLWL